MYEQLGQYEKSAEATRTLLQLDPEFVYAYTNLTMAELALQRFDEARRTIDQAHTRKLDDYLLRADLYAIAFLHADSDGMAEQQQWLRGKPLYENYGLALASETEAYAGHMKKARELTKEGVASAIRTENQEGAAVYQANFAVQQAAYANASAGPASSGSGNANCDRKPRCGSRGGTCVCHGGRSGRAKSLAQDLNRRFPLDTQVQSLWLPAIQTQLALRRPKPVPLLNASQAGSPVEYGNIPFGNNISCLYSTYVRGEAYLSAGQGIAAASEFQKILDHNGIVWNCWTGSIGASRCSSRERVGVENIAGR